MPRFQVLVATACLVACAPSGEQIPAAADPSATGWLVAAENDSMRVSVDTAGWRANDRRHVVWIGIDDISTPENRRSQSPFLRFETQQQIDCQDGRARGLNIRTPDSTGALGIHPVPDSAWAPFAEARMPGSILIAVCSKMLEVFPRDSA